MKTNVRTVTNLGLLFALSVVLSLVEGLVPPLVPSVPGIKLGLANIVTMYCLFYAGWRSACLVTLLKSGFVFLTRGFTAFLMSFAGGLCAVGIMLLLLSFKRLKPSYQMVSVCGAVFHNIGQLGAASLLLGTLVFGYLPVLLLAGIVMGLITGTLLRIVLPALKRFPNLQKKR